MGYLLQPAYPYGRPQSDASVKFLWEIVEIVDKFLMDQFEDYLKEGLSIALATEGRMGLTYDYKETVMDAFVEAGRRGWIIQAQEWSAMTLNINITKPSLDRILQRGEPKSVLALHRLHQVRRENIVRALMQVNIREDVNFAPKGDRANWPYGGEYLAGIELVEQLVPCDGMAMHYVHLCAEKWGAFIIAIVASLIPLSPYHSVPKPTTLFTTLPGTWWCDITLTGTQ